MEMFKKNLETFALKYKNQIKTDAEFRQYFYELCAKIGVDPLVSNKGFWDRWLGVGEFYYELSIQIIEISLETRSLNGGLMLMQDALVRLRKKRGSSSQEIDENDVKRAVSQLNILGNDYQIIKIGSKTILQSLPFLLSDDHSTLINLAQNTGYVTYQLISDQLKWQPHRIDTILESTLKDGMTWIDISPENKQTQYWFPTVFFASLEN